MLGSVRYEKHIIMYYLFIFKLISHITKNQKIKIKLVCIQFNLEKNRNTNLVRLIKSKRLRWAGHLARMEEGRSAFKILTVKPIGKRPLGRPRRRWEDNIRMDLEEIGINTRNWVDFAQDRYYWRALANPALNLRVS